MDTKKNSSLLKFYADHKFIFNEKESFVVANEEMLTWLFLYYGEKDEMLTTCHEGIYRNALIALTKIPPFEARVSLEVDSNHKWLILTYRTWGAIYLAGELILSFSHDTRFENKAFNVLFEWPELHVGSEKALSKIVEANLSLWTVDHWVDFFKKKLEEKAKDLKTKSELESQILNQKATSIFYAVAGKY